MINCNLDNLSISSSIDGLRNIFAYGNLPSADTLTSSFIDEIKRNKINSALKKCNKQINIEINEINEPSPLLNIFRYFFKNINENEIKDFYNKASAVGILQLIDEKIYLSSYLNINNIQKPNIIDDILLLSNMNVVSLTMIARDFSSSLTNSALKLHPSPTANDLLLFVKSIEVSASINQSKATNVSTD